MKSFAHEIHGMPVHATDGEIGTIQDVLFDPDSWTVRYLEVSTGWLFGRDVLIPVGKVKNIDAPDGVATFDCTKEQIENSPSTEPERAIDRDYETRLVTHYGLAPYWATPPEAGVPPMATRIEPRPAEETEGSQGSLLLSGGEIDGYDLDAQGETVGTVRDVLVDLDTWKVTSLMADLGGIFTQDVETIGVGPVVSVDRENGIVNVSTAPEKLGHESSPFVPPLA